MRTSGTVGATSRPSCGGCIGRTTPIRTSDVTSTLRQHPLDIVMIGVISTASTVLLGAPPLAVAIWAAGSAAWGLFAHARVRLPRRVERAMATVLQTPGTHRVHHAPDRPLTDSNFGLVLTVWDRMFGTFSPPNSAQVTGLDTADLAERQTVRAMLVDPWRPTVAPVQVQLPVAVATGAKRSSPDRATVEVGGRFGARGTPSAVSVDERGNMPSRPGLMVRILAG